MSDKQGMSYSEALSMKNYGGRSSAESTDGRLVDFDCTIGASGPVVRITWGTWGSISIPQAEFEEVFVALSEWFHPTLPDRMKLFSLEYRAACQIPGAER